MLASHLMMRLVDGRVLAPTASERRIVARVVLEAGRPLRLLCFRLPDGHLHAVLACDRAAAGRFARIVGVALRKRLHLPVAFAPVHVVPVLDQRHLESAFDYVLRNEERHGAATDLLHDASNLPDLLGLRLLGRWSAANVRAFLPRTQTARLLEILGAPKLAPGWDDTLAVAAAAGAAALPDLGGHDRARRACQAAVARGWTGTRVALSDALGVSGATLRRLREVPEAPAFDRALRLQIGLRMHLAEAERAVTGPLLAREPEGVWWGG